MAIGHCDIAIDEIKNLRADLTLDDGSPFDLENNFEYGIQNIGDSEVSLTEREVSRGVPTLISGDVVLIPPRGGAYIQVEAASNFYAWSLNARSRISVTKMGSI